MNALFIRSCLLVVLLCAIFSLCPIVSQANSGKTTKPEDIHTDKIVAKVNGQPIYANQLTPLVEKRLGFYQRMGGTQSNDETLRLLQKEALEKIIPTELLYQESLKTEIPDAEDKIAKRIVAFKAHPRGDYKNKSEVQLHELAKKEVYIANYFSKNNLLTPEVPENEIKEYYEQNKNSFAAQTDRVRVRHILVQLKAEDPEELKEQARQKIDTARQLIVEGRDFGEIAKEFSEDNAAASGGDIGLIDRGYMPPEVDVVAFALEPGQLSEVLTTKHGYHLLEVLEVHQKGRIPSYEELKEFIGKFLQQQLSQKIVKSHIQTLRENNDIEILLN